MAKKGKKARETGKERAKRYFDDDPEAVKTTQVSAERRRRILKRFGLDK